MEFRISTAPLDPATLKAALEDPRAGACVAFEGWVRVKNDEREVAALEYEAYPELAEKEGRRILAEARSRFALLDAVAVHRAGHLAIGELAVWVGVTAEHRDAAFAACRYIIDETKARVPIWKKEHYRAGESQWINCATRTDAAPGGGPA